MACGVGHLEAADEPVFPVDGDVVLVAKGWDRNVALDRAIGFGLALENLTVQRALTSFCAAFAGSSGHISSAVLQP